MPDKDKLGAEETTATALKVTTETADTAIEETKIQMAETVEEAKAQVIETVEQAKADIAETIRTEVAAQVTAAQAENPPPTATDPGNQYLNNLIGLTKTQLLLSNIIMFIVIIGMMAYIVFDKINDKRQTDFIQETNATDAIEPSIIKLFNPDKKESPVVTDTYQQIISKQANTYEQKPTSDNQMREDVGMVILRSDKVSEIIQANIEALKRKGLSDIKAIPKSFLEENVAPAVLAELPEETKGLPQALEFIKSELVKISNFAEKELIKKELNKR